MTPTSIDVTDRAALSHREAMSLQAGELQRAVDLLRSLSPEDWDAQTDCPDWNVHHMYLHVLGAVEAGVSMRENVHQLRAAKKHQKAHGGPLEAGLSNVQVRERVDMSPGQLVDRLAEAGPIAVRKRTRMPALLRRMKMKIDGPVVESWPLGYLIGTIYMRDLWMHRVDTAFATDREMELTEDHDGRIVADVVAEWARRHGQPVSLVLTGPAGGVFTARGGDGTGGPGEPVEVDAVEFCRSLAGRAPTLAGLPDTIVPF
jgi:uncharacterized protein (TIGR03083 family)